MSTLLFDNAGETLALFNTGGEAFYQDYMSLFESGQTILTSEMETMLRECADSLGRNPVDHWNVRLKPVASVKDKLRHLGYPVTAEAAVTKLHDVVAARAVCAFIDDIYFIREWFYRQSSFAVVKAKDYIKHPKPNGYRSCHLIVRTSLHNTDMLMEIQLHTLAWIAGQRWNTK